MRNADQGALPLPAAERVLARAGSKVAEYYIGRIRAMLGADPLEDSGRWLWHVEMKEGDRKFILRAGRMDESLAALDWSRLDRDQRAAFVAAFCRLRDWVNSFRAAVPAYSANGRRV